MTQWSFFFFNDTATTEIYTLSLHDALPILDHSDGQRAAAGVRELDRAGRRTAVDLDRHRQRQDRKSTRLNSSHVKISYAVFCLKKKKKSGRRRRLLSLCGSVRRAMCGAGGR